MLLCAIEHEKEVKKWKYKILTRFRCSMYNRITNDIYIIHITWKWNGQERVVYLPYKNVFDGNGIVFSCFIFNIIIAYLCVI